MTVSLRFRAVCHEWIGWLMNLPLGFAFKARELPCPVCWDVGRFWGVLSDYSISCLWIRSNWEPAGCQVHMKLIYAPLLGKLSNDHPINQWPEQ